MAATNINRVVLTGNLTRDPELRSTAERHVRCARCGSRCNTRRKDRPPASGSTSPTTSTSRSGARRARTAPASCAKGRPVAIDGRLEWREWQDKEGNKRQAIEIVADSVQFLGGRDDAGMGGGRRQRLHPALGRPGRHARLPARRRAVRQQPRSAGDDDIPF